MKCAKHAESIHFYSDSDNSPFIRSSIQLRANVSDEVCIYVSDIIWTDIFLRTVPIKSNCRL